MMYRITIQKESKIMVTRFLLLASLFCHKSFFTAQIIYRKGNTSYNYMSGQAPDWQINN